MSESFDNVMENKDKIKIKKAARTVIFDNNGMTPIINVRNGEYYKIPGGGIEEDEDEETAAIREAKEESGCDVEILDKVGEQEFLDESLKYGSMIHHSVCFLAKLIGEKKETNFNEWEKSNDFKMSWVTFEEAYKLFESSNIEDFFGKNINQRDYEFLKKAKKMLDTK